jgi:fucose 4-O-acetylase-like acetyltransferase
MGGTVLGERPPRRNDIDWLRIAAVLLLIPYHTARVFNWEEDFYVKNDPTSDAAQRFVDFAGSWHMSFLFLLAGAASWLAFRHRGGLQYAGERAKRLLVPFVFGLVVIVPPQTWLAYRWHGKGDISFWDYYPKFWTTADENLEGYQGGFTPGHLWFVFALFAFSLVGLPLFLWLRNRASGRRVLGGFGRLAQVPGLVLLVPAAILVLPWYLMGDDLSGQPPIGFFVVVVLGFMLFGDERIGRAIDRSWIWMLAVGVTADIVYMWAEPRAGDLWDTAAGYFGMRLLYEIGVWGTMLGLLGLGHRFLTAGGAVLRYATEAAYPFYILHQTVIVAVAYVVCAWDWPVWAKFALIAVASLALSVGMYEVAVRRWGPVRFLFGMKSRKRAAPAAPPEPVPPPAPAS